MTIQVISWNTYYTLSVNQPHAPAGTYKLVVKSELSNLPLLDVPLTIQATNSRYTQFSFLLPSLEGNKHLNSMCNYTIFYNTGVWDKGSLKLIYSPGGGTGTKNWISNNENRQAIVYYTPEY